MVRADQGPGCKHLVEVIAADERSEILAGAPVRFAGRSAGCRRNASTTHLRVIPATAARGDRVGCFESAFLAQARRSATS
jgi:hypothetical protein